jgi:hypothetical protein
MSTIEIDKDEHNPVSVPLIDLTQSRRIDREELMMVANDLVRFLHSRTMSERFREQAGDKTRLAYARVELSAIQAYSTLLRDEELEDLNRRLEALEMVKGRNQK